MIFYSNHGICKSESDYKWFAAIDVLHIFFLTCNICFDPNVLLFLRCEYICLCVGHARVLRDWARQYLGSETRLPSVPIIRSNGCVSPGSGYGPMAMMLSIGFDCVDTLFPHHCNGCCCFHLSLPRRVRLDMQEGKNMGS